MDAGGCPVSPDDHRAGAPGGRPGDNGLPVVDLGGRSDGGGRDAASQRQSARPRRADALSRVLSAAGGPPADRQRGTRAMPALQRDRLAHDESGVDMQSFTNALPAGW